MNDLATPLRQPVSVGRPEAPGTVVLVGPLPPPSGGMANQTRQLAELLAAEGCRVRVVQVNAAYRPAWIASVRGARALFRLLPYLLRLWRDTADADVVHVMANSGWAWHLFAAPAIWIAALRKRPVIVNYRGGDAAPFFARQFRWVRPTLQRASTIVVPSGFLGAVFAKFGIPTTVVPNIINLSSFRPSGARVTPPHFIVTRNLEPIYDIGTAIRAFAIVAQRHGDATLTIAGSGPSRADLERLVDQLGVAGRVRFTGRLDNKELPDLYRSASVAVNASLVDNMPISLLEAMASGVPIVSTNVGGVPYMVADGESALLVPPKDAEAMAAAMCRLIDDEPLASRLVARATGSIGQYAWPEVRERLFGAYAQARQAGGTQ